MTDTSRPPLQDLAKAFGPKGESGIFPHPVEVRQKEASGYYWSIDFSVGNKNTSLPSTQYFFGTALDATKFKEGDSVTVKVGIGYSPF